jgi:predicted transcriptional regulator
MRGVTRMNKRGDSRIRKLLYVVAMQMTRKGGIMHEYFKYRKDELKKPGKVILVSVMRKLLYLIQAIVKSGVPFNKQKYMTNA